MDRLIDRNQPNETLDYIETFNLIKINVFALYDFGTVGQYNIESQKLAFAKEILNK